MKVENLKNRIRGAKIDPIGDSKTVSQTRPALANKILVGTHHKTGTVWFIKVFATFCRQFDLAYYSGPQSELPVAIRRLPRGSQQIRPAGHQTTLLEVCISSGIPENRIISGTFYHQKSVEPWLHVKDDKFVAA